MSLRARPESAPPPYRHYADDDDCCVGATAPSLYSDAVRMRPELLERVREEHTARVGAAAGATTTTIGTITPTRLRPPPAGRPRPVVGATPAARGSVVAEVFGDRRPRAPVPTEAKLDAVLTAKDGKQKSWPVFDVFYSDEQTPAIALASWKREPDEKKWTPGAQNSWMSYKPMGRPADAVFVDDAFVNSFPGYVGVGSASARAMERPVQAEKALVFENAFSETLPTDVMGYAMVDGTATEASNLVMSVIGNDKANNTVTMALAHGKIEDVSAAKKMKMRPFLMQPSGTVIRDASKGADMGVFGMLAVVPAVASPTDVFLYAPFGLNEGRPDAVTEWRFQKLDADKVDSIFGARVVPVAITQGAQVEAYSARYGHTLWMARRRFAMYHKRTAKGEGEQSDTYASELTIGKTGRRSLGASVAEGEQFEHYPDHYVEVGSADGVPLLVPALLLRACAFAGDTEEDIKVRNDLLMMVGAPKGWINLKHADLLAGVRAGAMQDNRIGEAAAAMLFGPMHTDLMTLWSATLLLTKLYQANGATFKFDKILKSGAAHQLARSGAGKAAKGAARAAKGALDTIKGAGAGMRKFFRGKPSESGSAYADELDAAVDAEFEGVEETDHTAPFSIEAHTAALCRGLEGEFEEVPGETVDVDEL